MVTIKLSDEEFRLLKLCMSCQEARLDRYVRFDSDCSDKIKKYHVSVRDLYYKLISIK